MRIKYSDTGKPVRRQVGTNHIVHVPTGWLVVECEDPLVVVYAEVCVTYDLDAGDHRLISQEARLEPLGSWTAVAVLQRAIVRWIADGQLAGDAAREAVSILLRHAVQEPEIAGRLRELFGGEG